MKKNHTPDRLPINKLLDTFTRGKQNKGQKRSDPPKLENVRISVIRSFLKGIKHASKIQNPSKGLHRCIQTSLEWAISWHRFQEIVQKNYQEINLILLTVEIPRGQPSKGLKKLLKHDIMYHAYCLYIDIISSWNDPSRFAEIFGIKCCTEEHDDACMNKWLLLIDFLRSKMESKRWLRQ